MPKFTVHLMQQWSYYETTTVEDIEADTPEQAAALAKLSYKESPTPEHLELGYLDVDVQEIDGPGITWREDG